jgi:hypothetical protein
LKAWVLGQTARGDAVSECSGNFANSQPAAGQTESSVAIYLIGIVGAHRRLIVRYDHLVATYEACEALVRINCFFINLHSIWKLIRVEGQ